MPADPAVLNLLRFEPTPSPHPGQLAITAFVPGGSTADGTALWSGMAAIVWEPRRGQVCSVGVVDVELADGASLRRRGIAGRLWALAEAEHGGPLTDDGALTVAGSRFLNATGRPRAPFVQRVRTEQAMRVLRHNLWQWPPVSEGNLAELVAVARAERQRAG